MKVCWVWERGEELGEGSGAGPSFWQFGWVEKPRWQAGNGVFGVRMGVGRV